VIEYHLYFKNAHTDSPGWVVHAENVKLQGEWDDWLYFYRGGAPVLIVAESEIRLMALHYPEGTQ